MYSKIILCTLLAHIVGDSYLQTSKATEEKNKSYKVLFLHSVIYCIPFLALYLFSNKDSMLFKLLFYLCLSHLIIDFLKISICRTKLWTKYQDRSENGEIAIYLLDQLLHIAFILGFSIYFVNTGLALQPVKLFESIAIKAGISIENTMKWTLLILLIYKPTNITFSKLFKLYKPVGGDISSKTNAEKNEIKAGAMIGFLERALLIIFFSIGQYSSIALVMTAKSIARYEKLSKDEKFAEYYLIGTLSSMIMAIFAYYLVFRML